jgi:two-component system sensor histidine kinase/response regulator
MTRANEWFDNRFFAAAAREYVLETGSVLALRLDRENRVLALNAQAAKHLGHDALGLRFQQKLAGGPSANQAERIRAGDLSRFTLNTASGMPEAVSFFFYPFPDGLLALGTVELGERPRLLAELKQTQAELKLVTSQLQQANAELSQLLEINNRNAQQTRESNEALRHPGLAWLNLMEDALAAQRRAEQASESLRESEAQFRSFVAGAPDAIYVHTDYRFSYVNAAALRLFGADHPDQLLGSPILDRFHPSMHEVVQERLVKLLVDRVPVPPLEEIILTLSGQEVLVEISLVPITFQGKAGAMAIARDLTERKQAEFRNRELELAAARAEAANKAKSAFLSTMSHEIRTPMNAILGYTQLMLRDTSLGAEAKANLSIINRSGEHLLSLISGVLDMAKIEAGRAQVTPTLFDLRRLLRDLESMFRLPAENKGLRFDASLGGERVNWLVADEGKIRQVLINLVGNAIKFTERGRVRLDLSLNYRGSRLWLCAYVEDSGVGMTPEEQSALFQPFVQGQSGLLVHHGGTGQGLAGLMGGEINVSSVPGSGSSFRFEIPVECGEAANSAGEPPARGRVVGIQSKPGLCAAPRILIAEDVPESRDWLSRLLLTVGFDVRCVADGQLAVHAWQEWRPHLILMDTHMPVLNGLEASRLIRSQPGGKETVIIALTADATEDHHRVALQNKADDFISKPCFETELLEKIRLCLGISYIYDRAQSPAGSAAMPDEGPPERLPGLPSELVDSLLGATLNGDKALLDQLIHEVDKRGCATTAQTLQRLADQYQYDRLTELLERS